MKKVFFLNVSLFALCALVMPMYAAQEKPKSTLGRVVEVGGYICTAAWAARTAKGYLESADWCLGSAARSAASDAVALGRSSLSGYAEPAAHVAQMVLPATPNWTVKSHMLALGSMALAMGMGMLVSRVEEGGLHVQRTIKNYTQDTVREGFHCYWNHSDRATKLAVVSRLPLVIAGARYAELSPLTTLEVVAATGAAYLFVQSHLCKKHHAHELLQEEKEKLKTAGKKLQVQTAILQLQLAETDRKLSELTRSTNPRYLELC